MGFGGRTQTYKKIIEGHDGGGGAGITPEGTLCTLLAEIENRAGVPSAEGSQCQLHPAWSAGWTLSARSKFGLIEPFCCSVRREK